MPIERLILLGAGGHAKVVADAARLAMPGVMLEVRDDDVGRNGVLVLGIAVCVPIGALDALRHPCHVAIGDNAARRRIGSAVLAAQRTLATVIHPRASVAAQAVVGDGVFAAAGAIVAPDARVETGVIVNHGAVVDHDCRVGAWTHIAPNAVLGGEVSVGADCLIGSGAVVLPGVAVGDGAVIGSGAVVTRNVAPGAVVVGVPGRSRHE